MAKTKRTLMEEMAVNIEQLFSGFNRAEKQLEQVNIVLAGVINTNQQLSTILVQLASFDPAAIGAIVLNLQILRDQVQLLVDSLDTKAFRFKFFNNGREITGMESLTATQQEVLTLTITTKSGKPAKVDGAPVWTSSDVNVATVEAAPDGMSATVKSVNGDGGVCQVTATGDADLGAGVEPITGFVDFTIAAGNGSKAAVFALTPSAPTEQVPAP